jgi:hypothetical protein
MTEKDSSENLSSYYGPYYSMVQVYLEHLDGSSESALALMTGVDPIEYGGMPSLDSATSSGVGSSHEDE